LWRPADAARVSASTVAAYSLTPDSVRRLHAWQQSP